MGVLLGCPVGSVVGHIEGLELGTILGRLDGSELGTLEGECDSINGISDKITCDALKLTRLINFTSLTN